ncbi:MAG TPA: FAD-dependent oxidoreductase [Bacteroidota bacterium]|nr:FAD-dependent oxidoreductase [Bacteroidota bacterium]
MSSYAPKLQLRIGNFNYHDLFNPNKLEELNRIFFDELRVRNNQAFSQFDEYRRSGGESMPAPEVSRRIMAVAPFVDEFVAKLFGIEDEARLLRIKTGREQIIFSVKKEFFVRRVLKTVPEQEASAIPLDLLDRRTDILFRLLQSGLKNDPELRAAAAIRDLLEFEKGLKAGRNGELPASVARLRSQLAASAEWKTALPSDGTDLQTVLDILSVCAHWLAGHYYRRTGEMAEWIMFRLPAPTDFDHLVEYRDLAGTGTQVHIGPAEHYRHRDGFDLTDQRYSHREVLNEIDYCIFCHEREKDSCSRGFREKNGFRKNPLGYELKGCPLDQKISESHAVKQAGYGIGALAIIAIDNPLCPGTGHRICNDCMKACIYQKQNPVNIPQAETGILTDVLNLPWGFEIYSLLTRWNPLNIEMPFQRPFNGKKVLVVGMGPAGYTLAHYFLNAGFGVVGVDALKIEPLPPELTGDGQSPPSPVREYSSLTKKLSDRVLNGFGGVSEYGITVRWDKNFLTVLYLNLLRNEHFRLYDGVRFGGTISLEDVWELGFDHVCFATGAGKPTFVSMKNNLIRGIRKASDFLMALQLTGAGKTDSMANLQVRLPALVVGGGLTAVDSATELMAYYPVQVEKISRRYRILCEHYGEETLQASLSPEEKEILAEYLRHAGAITAERKRAEAAGEKPDFISLIRSWGGVTVCYRKSINDSPAYRLNHEEIIKAFEEGIGFADSISPAEAVPDQYGALREMVFEKMTQENGRWKASGELHRLPARTLLVAAGTSPNVMYEREHPMTFELDDRDEFFRSYTITGSSAGEFVHAKASGQEIGFFTSYESEGKFVSYYGDNHPVFEGNVVKAMASAKEGFRKVYELFRGRLSPAGEDEKVAWKQLVRALDTDLRPRVVRVDRLTPTIVEVVLHAPRAARKFEPGQFYRLQNYEVDAPVVEGTLMMMEGIALTGAWVDKERGLLSLIVLEFGSSTRMCSTLKPGQRVVVMGPTGAPTEILENSTVLLCGGGLGNAVLFSIARAFREKNNRVIYFAGYKRKEDLFKREEIEVATDVVVYSVDAGDPIQVRRPQDRSFVGNIVQAMTAYAEGKLGPVTIPLSGATRVIAIGSDRMMEAVTNARRTVLRPYLNADHTGIASINSPMQCMMKAVCAQCLQRHVDPVTKKEEFVFTCFNQDQNMDEVDFGNLNSRLKANTLMEKIGNRWLDYLFERSAQGRI